MLLTASNSDFDPFLTFLPLAHGSNRDEMLGSDGNVQVIYPRSIDIPRPVSTNYARAGDAGKHHMQIASTLEEKERISIELPAQ